MPINVPFLQYLRLGELGSHGAGFAHFALPANAWPMVLLPYLYGPIYAFGSDYPAGVVRAAWGLIGGYAGGGVVILAVARLVGGGGRDGGLRWFLAGWIALCLAKTGDLPVATGLMNLVPAMPVIAFFRYAEPSWELALILLAAGAIDRWQRLGAYSWRVLPAAAASALLLAAALWRAWPTMEVLGRLAGWQPFAIGALAWCVLLLVVLMALLAARPTRWRVALAVGLAGLDAVAMFALPLGSATRGVAVDRTPLDFLRAHLGLQRFYSMGAIPPNYGALEGLAQINHDMLPVPGNWIRYVAGRLDPLADPITFSGGFGGRPPGSDPRAMLLHHLDAYQALGVRYIVTLRGPDSLAADRGTARLGQPGVPLQLAPGATLRGRISAGFAQGRPIDGLAVDIGTYFGKADGMLSATLCTPSACARGQAEAGRGRRQRAARHRPLTAAGDCTRGCAALHAAPCGRHRPRGHLAAAGQRRPPRCAGGARRLWAGPGADL